MRNYTHICYETVRITDRAIAIPPPLEYTGKSTTTMTFAYMLMMLFDLLRTRMRLRVWKAEKAAKAARRERWRMLTEGLVTLEAQEAGAYEVLSRWEAEAIEEVSK